MSKMHRKVTTKFLPNANLTTAMKNAEANVNLSQVIILTDNEIKAIQRKLLKIFDDIVSVCEKEGIRYQLSGGSVLGAIRHGGYIPWDDDIDINMERAEIDRFVSCFTKRFCEKYWIKIPGKTPGYDQNKIRIESKQIRARGLLELNEPECGLWIDVFVIENTFDNKLLRTVHGIGTMAFRYILSCVKFARNEHEMELIIKQGSELQRYTRSRCRLGRVFSVIPLSVWTKLSVKWVTMCKTENTIYVVIPGGRHQFFRELYLRSKLCKTRDILFEKRKVKITEDYDVYMKILYGNDYMKIPPVEQREKHIMLELDRKALMAEESK